MDHPRLSEQVLSFTTEVGGSFGYRTAFKLNSDALRLYCFTNADATGHIARGTHRPGCAAAHYSQCHAPQSNTPVNIRTHVLNLSSPKGAVSEHGAATKQQASKAASLSRVGVSDRDLLIERAQ